MPSHNIFSSHRLYGQILGKYRLDNGNLALIIEELSIRQRYSVEFKTKKPTPCLENLYGLLSEPYLGKDGYLEHLLREGDYIDVAVNYRPGPLRHAYYLHGVYQQGQHSPQSSGCTRPYRHRRRLLTYQP